MKRLFRSKSISALLAGTIFVLCHLVQQSVAQADGEKAGPKGLSGGGDIKEFHQARALVPDPLLIAEAKELAAGEAREKFYGENKDRIEATNEVEGWAKLTLNFVKFLHAMKYPFTDPVIKNLTPLQVEQTFAAIFADPKYTGVASHFSVESELTLNKKRVLFISHKDTGLMELNLDYWNEQVDVDSDLLLGNRTRENLMKLPTADIIGVLYHEVLVMRGLEPSQQYMHSGHFGNAVRNFIENSLGTSAVTGRLNRSEYNSNQWEYHALNYSYDEFKSIIKAGRFTREQLCDWLATSDEAQLSVNEFGEMRSSLEQLIRQVDRSSDESKHLLKEYRLGKAVPMATEFLASVYNHSSDLCR